MSAEQQKRKRGRPRKNPRYDKNEVISNLLEKVVDLFGEPFGDRVERTYEAPTIREVAMALHTSPLRIRKLLITAEYYSTEMSRRVRALHEEGYNTKQIMDKTGLKATSVNSYLPYTKGAYNLPELSLNSERRRVYVKRKHVCERLADNLGTLYQKRYLWEAVEAFSLYPFRTKDGISFNYCTSKNELVVQKPQVVIFRDEVERTFEEYRARGIQNEKANWKYLIPIYNRLIGRK